VRGKLALREAPRTHEVVLAARDVRITRADPADRLLAAMARYYDLRLVTADERRCRFCGAGELPAAQSRQASVMRIGGTAA
jgi:predicted nucleic acid-binding protein